MCKIADGAVLMMLIGLAVLDWRKKEIPVFLLIFMNVIVVIISIFCRTESVWSRVGGLAIGIVLLIISKCTREAIGYGDSWLILILGIYVGALRMLQILFAASLLSAVCSLFYLWKRHWKKKETIPFVPFLALAYLGEMIL